MEGRIHAQMAKMHRELGKYLIKMVRMEMAMTGAAPMGMLSAVVCRVLYPNSLVMRLNTIPTPPIRCAEQAKRKKNHVLGSVKASMNLCSRRNQHKKS